MARDFGNHRISRRYARDCSKAFDLSGNSKALRKVTDLRKTWWTTKERPSPVTPISVKILIVASGCEM